MSTYLFVTAEQPAPRGWELYAPMKHDPDWASDLTPPLIVDGGWPDMARAVIDKAQHWGLPDDASAELRGFYNTCLVTDYRGCVAWGMYSKMKRLKTKPSSFGGSVTFGSLFSAIPNRGRLRLVFWWSHSWGWALAVARLTRETQPGAFPSIAETRDEMRSAPKKPSR